MKCRCVKEFRRYKADKINYIEPFTLNEIYDYRVMDIRNKPNYKVINGYGLLYSEFDDFFVDLADYRDEIINNILNDRNRIQ